LAFYPASRLAQAANQCSNHYATLLVTIVQITLLNHIATVLPLSSNYTKL